MAHDANPHWQINGEDWEEETRNIINHQLRTWSKLRLKFPPQPQNSCILHLIIWLSSECVKRWVTKSLPSPCQLLHTSSVREHKGIISGLCIPYRITIFTVRLHTKTLERERQAKWLKTPPPVTNSNWFASLPRFHADSRLPAVHANYCN